jgi:hypothetical protein
MHKQGFPPINPRATKAVDDRRQRFSLVTRYGILGSPALLGIYFTGFLQSGHVFRAERGPTYFNGLFFPPYYYYTAHGGTVNRAAMENLTLARVHTSASMTASPRARFAQFVRALIPEVVQ